MQMGISIIGAGRVGLCLGAVLAKAGFSVLLADRGQSGDQDGGLGGERAFSPDSAGGPAAARAGANRRKDGGRSIRQEDSRERFCQSAALKSGEWRGGAAEKTPLEKPRSGAGGALEILPAFHEPGLGKILRENRSNIRWAESRAEAADSDTIFFTLSAPITKEGDLDLRETLEWARLIARRAQREKLLIVKSSFPIGTNRQIQAAADELKAPVHTVTCPEFLRQGQAIQDIRRPDRIVIGARNPETGQKAEALYRRFFKEGRVIHTDPETAELAKLAANAFLSMKISFINEISLFSEACAGNMKDLRDILGADERIGASCFEPGLGFGGGCLPKDLQLLLLRGEKILKKNSPKESKRGGNRQKPPPKAAVLRAVQERNRGRAAHFFHQIQKHFQSLEGKSFAFWGLTFKSGSEGIANSPALGLARKLLEAGAELYIFDPLLTERDRAGLFSQGARARFSAGIGESLDGRDGLIAGAAGEGFQSVSLQEIKKRLKNPLIVQGRSLFPPEELDRLGFVWYEAGYAPLSFKKA